ncbi:MAG: ribbon-helix-helix protein, CopG family [Euryarchaeota archaeon]|nr:ribbon-helix-helix protein, CopG family [Euryarchaeota archaeon]
MENLPFSLRMREDLVKRIDKLSEKRDIPRAILARSLIAERLDQIEKEDAAPVACAQSEQRKRRK